MKPQIEKFGTATWYFCPSCHERIIFENGNLITGKKCRKCPECGQQLDWKEDVIKKKSKWRKFRQELCWKLGGEKREERCYFAVRTSHPDEVMCGDCEHNIWGEVGERW